MTVYLGKAKVTFGSLDLGKATLSIMPDELATFAPYPAGEITISGTFETDRDERRNMLVFWLMFSALAEASRILD